MSFCSANRYSNLRRRPTLLLCPTGGVALFLGVDGRVRGKSEATGHSLEGFGTGRWDLSSNALRLVSTNSPGFHVVFIICAWERRNPKESFMYTVAPSSNSNLFVRIVDEVRYVPWDSCSDVGSRSKNSATNY